MTEAVFPFGRRIIIVGQTCTGKSTLGEKLAEAIGGDFVELDALFWKPNWVESSDEEFCPRIEAATAGDAWVTAGSYHRQTTKTTWPRADTIIWLDLPFHLIFLRVITRSWRRWRRDELLWGTNREKFWQQLKLWSAKDSLITYAWVNRRKKQERMVAAMADPRWAHIRFIRLCSTAEVGQLLKGLMRS